MFRRGRHARPRRMVYRPALVLGLVMSLVTTGVALADGINADGDNVAASGNLQYNADGSGGQRACATRGAAVLGDVLFTRNGGSGAHFKEGSAVTITATPSALAVAQSINAAGSNVTIPIDGSYNANGETFNAVGALSTTVPSTAASGTYAIAVTATGTSDTNGTIERSSSFNVIIDCPAPSNAAPTVLTGALDAFGNEGDTLAASGAFADPDNDPLALTADNTVGTFTDNGDGTWVWSYATTDDVALATITVTADDGNGGSVSDSFSYSAANVAPSVTASISASINCQTNATLTFGFADPGVNDDDWTVDIDWGDGSTESYDTDAQGSQPDQAHLYTTPGAYHPTVTVTDKDGDLGIDNDNTIDVLQTYTVDFLPPLDDSTPSGLIVNKMKNGRVVPVKVTLFDDCGQSFVTDPDTDVTIKVTKTSGTAGTADPIEEYADAGQSSAGTSEFRWSEDGFWIYNLDSKALGLVINNSYRVDVYVGLDKATVDNWAVLQPVK